MKKHHFLTLALAVPMAAAGVALAAEETVAANSATVALKDEKAAPGTVRLSKFIGAEVNDPEKVDIGKISDVVLVRDFDRVGYVVLSQAKGLVGAREKLVALPYKAIHFGAADDDRVYVKMNRDILEKAPGFDDSKWPTQANLDYYRSLDAYYDTKLEAALKEQTPAGQTEPTEAQKAAAQMAEPQELEWSRRATKLNGRNVSSPKGENLGKISDIVVNQQTGDVLYAVLTDRGGDHHAVALNAFSVDPEDKKLILNTTPDELKQTPAFDEKHWPAKADPRWSKPATPPAQSN